MSRLSLFIGLAISFASPAYAQPITTVDDLPVNVLTPNVGADDSRNGSSTLSDAIALALDRNKELSATKLEIDAVEASIVQAGARPDPEISALMEDTKRATRTTTYQLNQPIELGGKRGARIDAAQRAYDIAVLEYAAKRAAIRSGVTAAYFDTMIAREKLHLAEELLKLTERSTVMTSRRVSAGKISPVEETKARVADAGARLAVNQAASDLMLARKRLSAYWGDLDSSFTPAAGNVEAVPDLPSVADLTARVKAGPAIRLARLEVERRRALARIESARRIPDLTVSVGNKRDEEARRNMWVFGVSVPIPVFDGNKGNELEALRRVDKARDELAATEIRIQGEAAQSYERMRNAGEEIGALRRDIIPGAESAYHAAAKGFGLGKFSFLDVLDAQRTYVQAKSQYWQALSQAHQASAELDRLTGPLSTEKE